MDARFVRTVVAVPHAKVAMEIASSVLVYFLQDLGSLIMIPLMNGGARYTPDILGDELSHNTRNSSFCEERASIRQQRSSLHCPVKVRWVYEFRRRLKTEFCYLNEKVPKLASQLLFPFS